MTVVLVHRERPERCADSAAAFLAQHDVDVELLVVDNASSAGARSRLRASLPRAEIVELDENRGFGPAANVGLSRWLSAGSGEWVAIAPHDALPEPDCLARMLEAAASRPRAGLASAEFGEDLRPVVDPYFGAIQVPAERGRGWEDAGHPHGSLLIARRSCLEEVGLFDERYFAYCEEADLAVRARRDAWEVGIVWGAIVHNPDLSTDLAIVEYLKLRNSLLLLRDHYGRYRTFIRLCFAAFATAAQLCRPARRPAGFDPRARVRAVLDFARGRFGAPPAGVGEGTSPRRPRAPRSRSPRSG